MEMLPAAFASGWASGINAYVTVLVLGLLGRFGHVPGIPEAVQRTDVVVLVGFLALSEFVADKLPYVDSLWDSRSTVVRPGVGTALGALFATGTGDLWTILLASTGGITALASHLTKSGLRMAVNTSPEPVTNVAASVGGDIAVTGVSALVAFVPVVAALIAGVLLLVGLVVLIAVARRVRHGWDTFHRWRRRELKPDA